MSDREELSMPNFEDDLADFAPRGGGGLKPLTDTPVVDPQPLSNVNSMRHAVDSVSGFPSREATSDGQLNLKGPQHILDRFKAICKADRRPYYDMLEIMMDRYEGRGHEAEA